MDGEALVVGVASVVYVVVYLYLGIELARRKVARELRVPALQFATFWLGLAATAVIAGVLSLYAAFTPPPFDLAVSLYFVNILVACAALWGLVGYLLFLYTGRSVIVGVSILYAVEYFLLVYYSVSGRPDGVLVSSGSVSPAYAVTVTGPTVILPVLLLVIPEFVATVAYLSLYFRTRDVAVRFRIACVGLGILGWFLFGITDLVGGIYGLVLSKVLIIVAVGVIWMAYHPPRVLRVRYGIVPI